MEKWGKILLGIAVSGLLFCGTTFAETTIAAGPAGDSQADNDYIQFGTQTNN